MSYTILWNPYLIKEKIVDLFSYHTRHNKRVILINYLDEITPKILPDVFNVNIYCYPQPGNIDPYALENLQKRGAKIYLTNPLNTNIYYVENEGILIGSANYNYTKVVLNCYENIKDIMVFIKDYSCVDMDNIINSLNKEIMDDKDLSKLKEEHHIFWKTFEGLNNLLKDLHNTNINNEVMDKCSTSGNFLLDICNKIKNILPVTKNKEHLINIKDKKNIPKVKYGIKDVNGNNTPNNNMNIYCVSKDDLYDILNNQLHKNKIKANNKKLH